ncbi:MAG TPA: Na+/H+ antiporter NhaA [Gemmatimonas sp.]|uniref:Na+/H+ antiporter NhaA n=1 Tax=Gemmatimonas sp. TaxID=1962908 RepID=UPI002ED8F974
MNSNATEGLISAQPLKPSQSLSGLLLLAATIAAMFWANSAARDSYHALWEIPVAGMSLHHVINDALMALFFLMVGLEIKHELQDGALSSMRQAALPIVGAIGGMVVPAAIYTAIAAGTPAARGWGIPMATDIAFALGVMALLGDRVPAGLRIFLAALAIADDIGAVLVIGLFYTSDIVVGALAAVVVIVALLFACNRRGVHSPRPYIALGIMLWFAVYKSGVHASIAGVLLAFTIPARGTSSVEQTLEHALQFPVSYGVIPLFALANAGVAIPQELGALIASTASIATAAGLLIGKPVGIAGAAWLAVRLRWASLPAGATWFGLVGVAVLGGIGFTMSLFVAALAFGTSAHLDAAKLGVLGGSLCAGLLGALLLAVGARTTRTNRLTP